MQLTLRELRTVVNIMLVLRKLLKTMNDHFAFPAFKERKELKYQDRPSHLIKWSIETGDCG